ncbi:hypothetical protein BO85DRAFT_472557 [Aspergillus piperis CBS 112811]|uniref:Uncharacterized protein n=1 Tax=Aspergillus piperis CBS 112811 TaxID=1448313 RepID=A0A8G1VJA7_9EURO|nr:hypothetical protein BO85DRAFT_472557 [Aspergillus piperis CBS 112811]RAH52553.1 hypothetical protein BO85DRAFT_472557 [Aspergillus piperis CBS 112811]
MAVAGRQRVRLSARKAQHNLARTVRSSYDWGSGEPQPWYALCFLTAGFLWVQVVFCQFLPVLPGK